MDSLKTTFFKLSGHFSTRTFQTGDNTLPLDEPGSGKLPVHYRAQMGNYEGIDFPVVFRQNSGSKIGDLMSCGYSSLFLISDRMKNLLEKECFTGWKTYPVLVYDKAGEEVPGYNGFSITGRCGPVDYTRCEVVTQRFVPHGPEVRLCKGLYVGLDEWDGSDFFLARDHYATICTKRVVDAVRKAKLTLIDFIDLMDIEMLEDDLIKRMKREAERLS